jgi:hypothetical protein
MAYTVACPKCSHSFEVSVHRTDTITHEVWEWCSKAVKGGTYPTRGECVKALNHLNPSTVSTQYQRWLSKADPKVRVAITLTRLGLDPNTVPSK